MSMTSLGYPSIYAQDLPSELIESDGKRLLSTPLFRESKDVGRQELALLPGDEGHLHHIAFTKEDASDILVDGQYLAEARVEVDPVGLTRQPHGEAFSLFLYDPVGCLESHMATALSFHHQQQLSPGILDASL